MEPADVFKFFLDFVKKINQEVEEINENLYPLSDDIRINNMIHWLNFKSSSNFQIAKELEENKEMITYIEETFSEIMKHEAETQDEDKGDENKDE